jgi:hypothetical protein
MKTQAKLLVVLAAPVVALSASRASAQEVVVLEPPPPAPPSLYAQEFYPDVPAAAPSAPEPPAIKLDKKQRGFDLALDVSYARPIQSPITRGAGVGFDTRAGYRFADGAVFFAPGVDLGYIDFPNFQSAIRAGVGGRFGLDLGVVEPSIYGYGGGFLNIWKSGYGVRTGAALDFRAGRRLVPGLHVDYDAARWDDNGLRYVGVGAHLGLVL